MKFDKYLPVNQLKSYIKYFVVSEHEAENTYKVFPSPGLVIGFQYRGQLSTINGEQENKLSITGITGMTDRYQLFKSSAGIGTILVYFTEVGFAHFCPVPANEIFNMSVPLELLFDRNQLELTSEKLSFASTDLERVNTIQQFFYAQLLDVHTDKLVVEAVNIICRNKGIVRIKELNKELPISASPLEKRFRKIVGTSPKKFASIIRFNSVLTQLKHTESPAQIGYENNFFDQAHFIKDFKKYTGDTPENFKKIF